MRILDEPPNHPTNTGFKVPKTLRIQVLRYPEDGIGSHPPNHSKEGFGFFAKVLQQKTLNHLFLYLLEFGHIFLLLAVFSNMLNRHIGIRPLSHHDLRETTSNQVAAKRSINKAGVIELIKWLPHTSDNFQSQRCHGCLVYLTYMFESCFLWVFMNVDKYIPCNTIQGSYGNEILVVLMGIQYDLITFWER